MREVQENDSLTEATPLFGRSTENACVGRSVTFGTLPSPSATPAFGTSAPSILAMSMVQESVVTDLSFDEMRDSLMEGCCPADSVLAGALGLLTAAVTPSMLSVPLAFAVGGLPFAFTAILLCIGLTLASVRILALASSSAASDDYETVAGYFFGPWCCWLTRTILFFYNFGCSVVYLRFIYDSCASVLPTLDPYVPPWLSSKSGPAVMLAIFVLCATPLSFNARLASLRTKGFISNVLVASIVVAVVYRYFNPIDGGVNTHNEGLPSVSAIPSWMKQVLPYCFAGPIFLFSYEVQSNVMSVFKDLHDPSPSRIRLCVCLALAGATLFYVPLGLFGSWSDKGLTNGNILSIYDISKDRLMLVAQLCCCFSAAVSFVFVLFPCRFSFFMLITDGSKNRIPHLLRVRIGVLLSTVSCFLALFVPDVAMAVSVLGASCSSYLSMTLPALLSMKMCSSGTYCTGVFDRILSWVLLVGGLSFAILGTLLTVFYGS
jgi:amino acid permease